jgi:RNA ligase (TIGR02306 family)
MSSFAVTLEEIEVLPHPNADALELAKVGGYHAVIPKGKYSSGETVVYIPEQAILPDELISFMGLEGKLSGSGKNRVKPIRLRGELSQGLVMQLEDADEYLGNAVENSFAALGLDDWGDLSELFGIEKWVPPIPTEMSGQVEYCNAIVKWPDVENIKRHQRIP